jgi:DNA repair protein RadD
VCEVLTSKGITCQAVLGDTPTKDRDTAINAFKTGKLRALVNNTVLTTGFNVPSIDLVALLRPTLSPGLYLQMVGRGARIAEGKRQCVVLDFGGNVRRHGLLDQLNVHSPREPSGEDAPLKECTSCGALNHLSNRICTACEAPFPEMEGARGLGHAQAAGLVTGSLEDFKVDRVEFSTKPKPHGPSTLQVTYHCVDDNGVLYQRREWVCVEHRDESDGRQVFALEKARQWWRVRGGGEPPNTVQEAMREAMLLHRPTHVLVESGHFSKIMPRNLVPPADRRAPKVTLHDVGRGKAHRLEVQPIKHLQKIDKNQNK